MSKRLVKGLAVRDYQLLYWASEASPTLGCSIEISRDIMSVCICMSVVCQITWNHVNQTRACSKPVLGGKILPVTPVLFVSTIRKSSFSKGRKRNVHLEMRNLKQTELHRLKNRGKKG